MKTNELAYGIYMYKKRRFRFGLCFCLFQMLILVSVPSIVIEMLAFCLSLWRLLCLPEEGEKYSCLSNAGDRIISAQ